MKFIWHEYNLLVLLKDQAGWVRFPLVILVTAILGLFIFSGIFSEKTIYAESTRGTSGDLWADSVIGKRDFGEISPREIVPYKVSAPGGVIVDRSVTPGRMYVWDSGNNRILGIDLVTCYAGTTPCSASIVIGQPSGSDYGACNLDSSFSNYPNRVPSSSSSLCGVSEKSHTTLEDKTFTSMFVDSSGNLYVGDSFNHRVLKYNSPFTTDTIADDVWGQPDFSGNGCNITGGIAGGWNIPPPPTASSLCSHTIGASGSGVTLDDQGNLWVADGGNNRVLRFPKDISTEVISKTADIVLGQANFTTGGDWSYGNSMNRMRAPASIRFDNQGKLYVADSWNNRVLVFNPPFASGMNATTTFGTGFNGGPLGLELDTQNRGMWTFDPAGFDGKLKLWDFDGVTVLADLPRIGQPGGGSIGIDTNGAILTSAYSYGQDVYRFTPQTDGSYVKDKQLFSPPGGYNLTTNRRLEHPGWVGLGIAGDQLIVADSRLLFWDGLSTLSNGKPADGFVGTSSITDIPNPGFGQVKVDSDNRVWVIKSSEIRVYQAPLTTGLSPLKTLTSPLSVLNGGQITFDNNNAIFGIAPTAHDEFVWMSQPTTHRVFRVRDPLSQTPLIDVVLGQTDLLGNQCNRGVVPAPNTGTSLTATLNMLCFPGALSLDKLGNLYVSDHYLESQGNWRLLMFTANTFQSNNSQVLFAPDATKEFPRRYGSNTYSHATFEPAFDSSNRMVVGYNPYLGPRFPEFYNNPTVVNPSNPSDPTYAVPDGNLKDFYGWAVAATFDSQDNLYMYDANRGQVRIYKNPFNTALSTPTPTLTTTPMPTVTTTPTPTPIPTATPTPTPTPTPLKNSFSLNFNGTNQYVSVPNAASLQISKNITLEAWVRPTTVSGTKRIVGKNYYELYIQPSNNGFKAYWRFRVGGTWKTIFSGQLNLNQWYHIAGVYNGTTTVLFVNGTQVSSSVKNGNIDQSSASFRIGTVNASGDFLTGFIDEVRVSNTVRYTSSFNPSKFFTSDTNTKGLWHFDEGSGTLVSDASVNNNNGTLINSPLWSSNVP